MGARAKAEVLDALFDQLQRRHLMQVRVGKSRGGWSAKLHLVAATARDVLTWSRTSGQSAPALYDCSTQKPAAGPRRR